MRRLLALLAVVGILLAACGDDDAAGSARAFVSLDGSPRVPDTEGVVVDVAADFSTLTMDDGSVYEIHEDLQSFAAADGSIQPVIRWKGLYAQLGLAGDTVEWIGGVASVVSVPGQPAVVYITGVIVDVGSGRVTMRSGAVFRLGDGLSLSEDELPLSTTLILDVETRAITAIEAG